VVAASHHGIHQRKKGVDVDNSKSVIAGFLLSIPVIASVFPMGSGPDDNVPVSVTAPAAVQPPPVEKATVEQEPVKTTQPVAVQPAIVTKPTTQETGWTGAVFLRHPQCCKTCNAAELRLRQYGITNARNWKIGNTRTAANHWVVSSAAPMAMKAPVVYYYRNGVMTGQATAWDQTIESLMARHPKAEWYGARTRPQAAKAQGTTTIWSAPTTWTTAWSEPVTTWTLDRPRLFVNQPFVRQPLLNVLGSNVPLL